MRTAQRKKFTLVHDLGGSVHHGGKSVAKHSYSILEARTRTGMLAACWLCPFPVSSHLGSQHMGRCPPMQAGSPPPTSPLWKPSMLHHLPGDFKTSKIDLDNQPTHWAYWFLIRVTQVWPGVCPSKTGVSRPQTVTGDTCTLLCREGGGLCSLLTPSTDSKPRVLSSNLDFATDRSDLEKMATNASDLKENPPCPSA